MPVLNQLENYLAADATISPALVAGTNLFHGLLPPHPNVCVALFEYGSMHPGLVLGSTAINVEYPQVQVLVRGVTEDYDTPRSLIDQIVASFVKIGEQTLDGVRYSAVSPKQSPFYLTRDEEFRCLFACNFHIMKDFG